MKSKRSTKIHGFLGFILVLVILGSGAWAVYWFGYKDLPVQTQKIANHPAKAERLPLDLTGVLDVQKVREIVMNSTIARMKALELKKASDELIYTVVLSDGSVVNLDARTGQRQTGGEQTHISDSDEGLPLNVAVAVSFDKAREIAQEKFLEGSITRMQLLNNSGLVVLRVMFADNAEVDVDANTGRIVNIKSSTK